MTEHNELAHTARPGDIVRSSNSSSGVRWEVIGEDEERTKYYGRNVSGLRALRLRSVKSGRTKTGVSSDLVIVKRFEEN